MNSVRESRPFTVRLSPELFEAASRLARARSLSMNSLVQQSLLASLRADEEQARFDAYTQLGQDMEECDVEYAAHAQAEVMLHDEH